MSEADIEIKARFIDEEMLTDKAKFLFMLGEACYAATFKFYAPKSEEVGTSEQKEKLFENFMEDLTEAVKAYHTLGEKAEKIKDGAGGSREKWKMYLNFF